MWSTQINGIKRQFHWTEHVNTRFQSLFLMVEAWMNADINHHQELLIMPEWADYQRHNIAWNNYNGKTGCSAIINIQKVSWLIEAFPESLAVANSLLLVSNSTYSKRSTIITRDLLVGLPENMAHHGNYVPLTDLKLVHRSSPCCTIGGDKSSNKELFVIQRPETVILAVQNHDFNFSFTECANWN